MFTTEHGWLAGIIDGEGCLTMYKGSGRGHTAIRTDARIESTSLLMIDTCASIMQKIIGRVVTVGAPLTRSSSTRPAYRIQIHRKRELLVFLDFIRPLLVNKRAEADLIVAYLRRSCAVKYYTPTSEDLEVIQVLKDLKKKQ